LLALLSTCLDASAADEPAPKPEKPGDWVVLPSDGTPWKHEATGLRFPQEMGGFHLRLGFRDKNADAGIALSYVHETKNIKGDVVIFPCKEDLNKKKDVMAFLHGEHDKLVKDLSEASREQGYKELAHAGVEERAINLWQGNLPLTVQTFEFGPAADQDELVKPAVNQWFALTIYQDYFVEFSIVRPAASGEDGVKMRDELVRMFLQCIREPSVTPEMLKLCRDYLDDPLGKKGRDAVDALLEYSRASPVFKIPLPGEVLTPVLDAVHALDADYSLDLLRSFIVGSGVVSLQGGTAAQSLEEGARIMCQVYDGLKKKNEKVKSDFMEQLQAESAKEHAAVFLHEKMAAAPAPPAPDTSKLGPVVPRQSSR
jgi:hypothetical protein